MDGKPTWDGGSYERIEAQNRKALKAPFAKAAEEAEIEANGYFTWREVISPDGVLCYVTRFRPATTVKNVSGPSPRHIPNDLVSRHSSIGGRGQSSSGRPHETAGT